MSRGLGKLQSDILWSLDKSRDANYLPYGYPRGEVWEDGVVWISHQGERRQLPEGLYDLAAIRHVVAQMDPSRASRDPYGESPHGIFLHGSFESSFYRAIRSLINRGWLEGKAFVSPEDGQPVGKRLRFVSRPMCSVTYSALSDPV